mmetsp:Transcript_5584/g.15770  ORF Transcript_5584/g.15770 Transcript_5584/m.15770 type:complete len:422 (-) Transcript_5584:138-1403(-)
MELECGFFHVGKSQIQCSKMQIAWFLQSHPIRAPRRLLHAGPSGHIDKLLATDNVVGEPDGQRGEVRDLGDLPRDRLIHNTFQAKHNLVPGVCACPHEQPPHKRTLQHRWHLDVVLGRPQVLPLHRHQPTCNTLSDQPARHARQRILQPPCHVAPKAITDGVLLVGPRLLEHCRRQIRRPLAQSTGRDGPFSPCHGHRCEQRDQHHVHDQSHHHVGHVELKLFPEIIAPLLHLCHRCTPRVDHNLHQELVEVQVVRDQPVPERRNRLCQERGEHVRRVGQHQEVGQHGETDALRGRNRGEIRRKLHALCCRHFLGSLQIQKLLLILPIPIPTRGLIVTVATTTVSPAAVTPAVTPARGEHVDTTAGKRPATERGRPRRSSERERAPGLSAAGGHRPIHPVPCTNAMPAVRATRLGDWGCEI